MKKFISLALIIFLVDIYSSVSIAAQPFIREIDFDRIFEDEAYAKEQFRALTPSYYLVRRLINYKGITKIAKGWSWELDDIPEVDKATWRESLYPVDHLPNRHPTRQAVALFLIEGLLRQDSSFWKRSYALLYFKDFSGDIRGLENYKSECRVITTEEDKFDIGSPYPKSNERYFQVFNYYRKWLRESWWMGYKNPAQAHAKRRKLPLDGSGYAWDREDLK